jgi:hypothetical protein
MVSVIPSLDSAAGASPLAQLTRRRSGAACVGQQTDADHGQAAGRRGPSVRRGGQRAAQSSCCAGPCPIFLRSRRAWVSESRPCGSPDHLASRPPAGAGMRQLVPSSPLRNSAARLPILPKSTRTWLIYLECPFGTFRAHPVVYQPTRLFHSAQTCWLYINAAVDPHLRGKQP